MLRMLGNPKKVKDQFFLYLNLHIPIFFFFDHVTKKKKTRRKLLELEVTMHTQPIGNCPKTPMSLKYMP
jgi:hypothetical protein|uniref:Uncharacterized protein n=1 Tax=Populus trichocarpa TaxID=3694 RepID=A0A2K2A7M3_POPTR